MKLDDLFFQPAVSLPIKRADGSPLDALLKETFGKYMSVLDSLADSNPISDEVKRSQKTIREVAAKLVKAVESYLQGFPHAGYKHVKSALTKLGVSLDPLNLRVGNSAPMRAFERLYRIRHVERPGYLDNLERKALFHMPFELRHKVSSNRYSISGLPSLYLGGSLWVCWEELQRPDFHNLQIARFRYAEPVRLLDFGFRPSVIGQLRRSRSNLFNDATIASYLICWPLIAACSVRVFHPSMPFKPEYIVPQLLLQYLRNETNLDGLRYFSTRIDQHEHSPWAAMNYVFPVQEQVTHGYCPRLREKFCLTAPAAWSLLEKSAFVDLPMELDGWGIRVTEDRSVPYYDTEFFRCEHKLEGLACSKI
ncbi:MAG: hypothetical protein WAM89_18450 [Terriglobales bacterium]